MTQDELSVPETARILNVSDTTVVNMVERGDLTARIEWRGRQRRVYVARASVETWQAQQGQRGSHEG